MVVTGDQHRRGGDRVEATEGRSAAVRSARAGRVIMRRLILFIAVLLSPMAAVAQVAPSPGTPTHVICDSGCGSPVAVPDGSTFTAGTTNVALIAAAFDDSLAAVTAGKFAAPRLTAYRALHFNMRDAAGNEIPFPVALGTLGGLKVTCVSGCAAGTPGQATMANSSPVVIASDQSAVPVTGAFYQGTQPVSIASMPSTPVTNANLDAALSTLATAAKQPTLVSGRTPVDPSGVTSPVSLATLPALTAGSAVIGHVIVDTAPTTAVTGPLTDTQLRASAVPVSAATLPLPTLAATSTKQSDGTQKTQIVDGSGNVIGATSNALDINIKSGNPTTMTVTQGTGSNLHAVIDSGTVSTITNVVHVDDNAGSLTVDGTVTTTPPANASTNVTQFGGTNVSTGTGTGGAGIPRVTVSSDSVVGLGAGAAVIGHVIADTGSTTAVTGNVTVIQGTAANLNVTEASAAAIKTDVDKIPSQGQALAAASMPVVLTAAQVTTLTPPAAITGFALESTQLTGNTSLASVKTNTDPLVTAGGGGYMRQDSTATIAKETGGNLATAATNTRVRGTSSTPAMVMATDIDAVVLASNTNRVSWRVCNQSRSPMFVKLGSGATRFNYNVLVAPNSCYVDAAYTGQIDAVWDFGADQFAMVSETQ